MFWVAKSEKNTDPVTLEKRLWDAADQFRANSALTVQGYSGPTSIARTEREIALMQEYRTRLTADVVTGKLDVRAAAAHLPAVPTDSAPHAAADEPLEETEAEEVEA